MPSPVALACPEPDDQFVVRSWNGQSIRMRAGRVCLTDLCKAGETGSGNPIRFRDWFESDPTQRFLQHRSAVTGREVFAIKASIDNAENSALILRESERGDAWGDEVVSLKLAGRLCVELEHQIYEWYAETRVSQVRDTHPVPQEQDDWTWRLDICDRIGIRFDERDKLQLKEAIVGQKLLAAGSTSMVYADIPVSRAIQEVFSGLILPLVNLKAIGTHLSRWYREERGAKPPKHDQYVDGANRSVNTYPRDWIIGTLPRLAKTYPHLFTP